MLVESAAVYSIFGIIFIGTYFRRSPAGNLVLPFLGNLEGICPIMIIYRVAIGRGWTHKTLRQVNSTVVSELRFNENTKYTSSSPGETENIGALRLGNLSGAGTDLGSTTYASTGGVGDLEAGLTYDYSPTLNRSISWKD